VHLRAAHLSWPRRRARLVTPGSSGTVTGVLLLVPRPKDGRAQRRPLIGLSTARRNFGPVSRHPARRTRYGTPDARLDRTPARTGQGSLTRRIRRPAWVTPGPCDERLRRRGVGRGGSWAGEDPVVSNRGLGKRVDDRVGKGDGPGGHLQVFADTSGEVPGMNEQIQGREGQTFADRTTAHRRVDHLGQVDARHRPLSGFDQSAPPRSGLALDGTTGRIHRRPGWLLVHEQQRSELYGCADVPQDVQGCAIPRTAKVAPSRRQPTGLPQR
jgi:hypothetical protein